MLARNHRRTSAGLRALRATYPPQNVTVGRDDLPRAYRQSSPSVGRADIPLAVVALVAAHRAAVGQRHKATEAQLRRSRWWRCWPSLAGSARRSAMVSVSFSGPGCRGPYVKRGMAGVWRKSCATVKRGGCHPICHPTRWHETGRDGIEPSSEAHKPGEIITLWDGAGRCGMTTIRVPDGRQG
jgi:hypothetical protein